MNAHFVGKSAIHVKSKKSWLSKIFPMQIALNGMEMNVVILVNLSTTEVTGPSIVHLLPKHLLHYQPRWRKQLKHHDGSIGFWVRLPVAAFVFYRMADR